MAADSRRRMTGMTADAAVKQIHRPGAITNVTHMPGPSPFPLMRLVHATVMPALCRRCGDRVNLRHDGLVARVSLRARHGRLPGQPVQVISIGQAGRIAPLVDPRRYVIWLEQALADAWA